MDLILSSLITLGVVGCVSAVVLYIIAQKFKVEEDSRVDEVESVLPGANCGGCGYPGCRGFATACVNSTTLDGKLCPVGGEAVMKKVGTILGMDAAEGESKVAVVRCNGTCENRPRTSNYNGTKNCRIAAQLYSGETNCSFGCLGYGDCVDACNFDAININPDTLIPEVDEEKCTACGACVKACPKSIIELRNKGPKSRRVYVSCVNKSKGAVARKACTAACIGCGKCEKACPFGAIKIENNLAYIDYTLCRLCRKCVVECPTGAIIDVNFPSPAVKAPAKPVEKKVVIEEIKVAPAAPVIEAEPAIKTEPAIKSEVEQKTDEPQAIEPQVMPETSKVEIVVEENLEPTTAATENNTKVEIIAEEKKEISLEVVEEAPMEVQEEVKEVTQEEVKEDAVTIEIDPNCDVTELISEDMRVTPREKPIEEKSTPNATLASLDF